MTAVPVPAWSAALEGAPLLHAGLYGFTAALVLLLSRDRQRALLAAWLALFLLFDAVNGGFVRQHLLPDAGAELARLGLVLELASGLFFSVASLALLGLWARESWRPYWLLALAPLAAGALWLLFAPDLEGMRRLIWFASLPATLAWPAGVYWLRVRGQDWRHDAQLALLLPPWLAQALSACLELGWLPLGLRPLLSWLLLSANLTAVAGTLLIHQWRQRQSETQLQLALTRAERKHREQLEREVRLRTNELKQAMVSANAASRAKTDFLARVSHDLRSPLTAIMGYAQLLQAEGGRVASEARIIRRSADRMLGLINGLIDYAIGASGDRLDPAPLYIYGVLNAVAQEARMLADKRGNRFVMDIQDQLPTVLVADSNRLREILGNLLDNAAKYTDRGMIELLVSCQPIEGDAGRVELGLQVKDTGCGIAPADQARVFEPFFRADSGEESRSAGLGLAIVSTRVQQMGGRLELSSTPGVGTTVNVSLPLALGSERDMSVSQLHEEPDFLPALDAGGRLAWVIEDNDEIRELLTGELHRTGFEVCSASNGLEFIEQLYAGSVQPPSVVVTDYLMPGADGAAVLQAVRRHWPGVPVVLLSATQQMMESLGERIDHGFDASLMKPLNLAELRLTLGRLLGLQPATPPVPRGAAPSDAAAPEAPVLPPEAALVHLVELAEMGALTDLNEYLNALPTEHPPSAGFARRLQDHLAEGDLDAILQLCRSA